MKTTAFAYVDAEEIWLESIADTPDQCKINAIKESLGWRFDYADYHDEKWEMLEERGEIKEIEISIKQE